MTVIVFAYITLIYFSEAIISILKNHLHKTNIALAALTSLYVIGTAVALSTPYWVSSTSLLAPLAVFAATPLGISVLAFVAVALVSLAIYSIIKNNEISELKAPRIVTGSYQRYLMLQVTDKDLEFIEEIYKNENGEYIIDFTNSKGEIFKAASYGQIKYKDNPDPILLGNTKLLDLHQLYKKKGDSIFEQINCGQELETLGLGVEENDAKEVIIRFVPKRKIHTYQTECITCNLDPSVKHWDDRKRSTAIILDNTIYFYSCLFYLILPPY